MELEEPGQAKSFGDNDKLSALIAGKLGADLLVILTNVDGIYTDNPFENSKAELIPSIEDFEKLSAIRASGQSDYGRGGISSKIEAAKIAAISGVTTAIVSGFRSNVITDLFEDNETPRTVIWARAAIHSKKQWLGHASGFEGVVVINDGAKNALVEQGASLLAAGISAVDGDFKHKSVVSIQDETRTEIGRGLTNFSSDEIRKIQGTHSNKIHQMLGHPAQTVPGEVVHRDNLVIFSQIYK
jgi:glutamate 5-kinase